MTHSLVRFLRFYASVVVLLVSSVLAFGVEPVGDDVDFSNVISSPIVVREVGVSETLLPRQLMAFATLASDAHVSAPVALDAAAVRSLAWTQQSSRRGGSAAKLCGQAILRVRRES